MKTFQSKFYHNKHSEQRDNFLTEMFGVEWLKDMKSNGYFGNDWDLSIIGTPKGENWKSVAYDKDGNIFQNEEVDLDASSS